MLLIGRTPPPPLSRFVELLWYATEWKPPHAGERHMPDGAVNLIISLREEGAAAPDVAGVMGARSEASFIDTSEPDTLIGVYFKRGGARPFVDGPLTELTNSEAPLEDVARAGSLREELLEARDPEARLDRLQGWLLQRLRRRPEYDPAIAWAVRQFERQPHVRVSAVADHIGRSSRWFIDRFAADVGLTPKVFSRIQRFQHVLGRLHSGEYVDLADLAVTAGYYDQAHLTHDFRSIAGMTPSAYLAGRTDHRNHVAIPG